MWQKLDPNMEFFIDILIFGMSFAQPFTDSIVDLGWRIADRIFIS